MSDIAYIRRTAFCVVCPQDGFRTINKESVSRERLAELANRFRQGPNKLCSVWYGPDEVVRRWIIIDNFAILAITYKVVPEHIGHRELDGAMCAVVDYFNDR
jgi:hypothetical protein